MNSNGPPLFINYLFGGSSSDSEDGEDVDILEKEGSIVDFPITSDRTIKIREFSFQTQNANFIWKGNEEFAQWLLERKDELQNKRILELATATGLLSIFMKQEGFNITSSDYNDPLIEENMKYNMALNGLDRTSIAHIPYNWGDPFEESYGPFDIVIANDILIYNSVYQKLAESIVLLSKLLFEKEGKVLHFYLGHKRRVNVSPSFFEVMESNNFVWNKVGPYIYDFYLNKS